MPHKHKRKADGDEENYDLPPSIRAAPLPVTNARAQNLAPRNKKRKTSHADGYGQDDTPKAFARLMHFQSTGKRRSGLDDGPNPKAKKQKPAQKTAGAAAEIEQQAAPDSGGQPHAVPKIKPGERLSEFSARVNQAMPLASVARSGKKIAGMSDHRVTKHEKKLKRLQDGWRKEEARLREKEQEERELAEEEQDEIEAMWEDKTTDLAGSKSKKKGKKKGKRKLVVGEVDDKREDEWEALRKKRDERKGLNDVVHAPPQFDKTPREVFKIKNGAKVDVDNVPSAAGSLRKREELREERQTIIETYRKLMAAKKGS